MYTPVRQFQVRLPREESEWLREQVRSSGSTEGTYVKTLLLWAINAAQQSGKKPWEQTLSTGTRQSGSGDGRTDRG